MAEPIAAGAGPDGIERAALDPWLVGRLPGARAPFGYELIAGGQSNLTFLLTDTGGQRWALRRQPLGTLLPRAHDLAREYRIVSALASSSDVPVPEPVTLCTDGAVTGAMFYVMAFVAGAVLRDGEAPDPSPRVASRLSHSAVDTLAALHTVSPDAIGLGDLGRRDGYVERQLQRWHGQLSPLAHESLRVAHGHLTRGIPPHSRTSLVHGDYRLDNLIIGPDGDVAAVLDWELATLGDPLVDLATLLNYWAGPGHTARPNPITAAAGFDTRDELAARYAATTQCDLGSLPFYRAFASWRHACILDGVATRWEATSTPGAAQLRERSHVLAGEALVLLNESP